MSHPAEANEVMEAVQRVTTGAGLRARSATDLSPRGWCSMTRKHNVGRFVPDNECTKEQSQVCIITEGGANPTCPASTMIASKRLFCFCAPVSFSVGQQQHRARVKHVVRKLPKGGHYTVGWCNICSRSGDGRQS